MTMANEETLILYLRNGCGYCYYVQDAIRKLGLTVEERNIWEDPAFEEELMSVTGRRVVPVLRTVDNEGASRWIPESRDIIEYLVSHHSAD